MNTAIIGFGSNITPEQNIPAAKKLLSSQCRLIKESSFITTKPIGDPQQNDFVNGSVLVETDLDCAALKDFLKSIERQLGRQTGSPKFGPRTIDLDIVIWNEKVVDDDFFTRDFVKKSVLELLPHLS